MKGAMTLRSVFALLLLATVALLVVLNWPALMAMATWQLGFAEVQLPVGAAMLLLTTPLLLIYLGQRIGSVIETRRLLHNVQRLQKLADQAEASRIEGLRELIAGEFGRLNRRIDALMASADGRPASAFSAVETAVPDTPAPRARVTGVSRWFRSGL